MINCFDDFIRELLEAGFSLGGGNDEGIFALIPWGWQDEPPYETSVRWHTGDMETDPWEWRMRVLDERNDIAYAKLFFKKSGFITREWYPYFLAVRRGRQSFEEKYADGSFSHFAKRIYDVIAENGATPVHGIKQLGGFSRDEASKFDRALVELQTGMFLTMCGRRQKLSRKGEEYGWSSTVLCTPESYFGERLFWEAEKITQDQAAEKITERVLRLNPCAEKKKIAKFIKG